MVLYTKSSISTRFRCNTTSYTTASTISTPRAACHSSQINPRRPSPTCNSGSPANSLRTSAITKVKESTKKDKPGPVWAATPLRYNNSSSRDTCQSDTRLLTATSFIGKLKTSPVTTRSPSGREKRYKEPSPDTKHTYASGNCGILRHHVEVLHYRL